MEHDISKSALERITRESIKPESKFVADLRKIGFWIPVVLVVLLGSIASAAIYFIFANNDWDLAGRLGAGFILRSMPYFWVFFLAVFVLLGEFTYAKTTVGYRYGILKTMGVYMLMTLVLGGVFSVFGIGAIFERGMAGHGFMQGVMFNQTEVWSHPEQGLLSGTITSVASSSMMLTDFPGKEWSVDLAHAFVRGRAQLESGALVKVLGSASGTVFTADEVRPWVGGNMMNGGGMHAGINGASVGGAGRRSMMR